MEFNKERYQEALTDAVRVSNSLGKDIVVKCSQFNFDIWPALFNTIVSLSAPGDKEFFLAHVTPTGEITESHWVKVQMGGEVA